VGAGRETGTRSAGAAGGSSAQSFGNRATAASLVERPAQPDLPGTLSDLQLREPARGQPRDERRKEVGSQPLDGTVVVLPSWFLAGDCLVAHWLHLVAGWRLVSLARRSRNCYGRGSFPAVEIE
jgi:hypothetical protein